MAILRPILGWAIMMATGLVMGPALRLTDDIALRILMLPVFFALAGLGVALICSNRRRFFKLTW
jgi:hypothetical protein